uniref:Uncharacterized protein n=1 Tax=Mola mola TaxID=94237 RepID=A0A3Q3WTL7_MOLML
FPFTTTTTLFFAIHEHVTAGPISEDLPKEADLVQMTKLIECLKANNAFEDDLELSNQRKCEYFKFRVLILQM